MKKIIAVSAVALSAALVSAPAVASPAALDGQYVTLDALINTPSTGYQALADQAAAGLAAAKTLNTSVQTALGTALVAKYNAYKTATLALYGTGTSSVPAPLSIEGKLAALRPGVLSVNNTNDAAILNAYLVGGTVGGVQITADATKYATMIGLLQDRATQTATVADATAAINASNTALNTAVSGYTFTSATTNLEKVAEIEANLSTKTTASTAAAATLAGAMSSQTLLAAAAASPSTHIARAANALTTDTLGANYETEVLGALVNHDNRIVSLEALTSEHTRQIAALNDRVDRLDEKVASSTATAIAMGGGAFLPDMKFNLSGNIATYDGAQAIAASIGYRVSNNVALTASIGGGLNKGGKVGGRVGFIFGW